MEQDEDLKQHLMDIIKEHAEKFGEDIGHTEFVKRISTATQLELPKIMSDFHSWKQKAVNG